MQTPVVDFQDVHFRYFGNSVLEGASFRVLSGCVCALIGENGTGKTTLIKHILGGLVPQSGSVRVFGLDPVADPAAVLSQIGYVSEDRDMPQWMTVDEYITYIQAFYPSWDNQYAQELHAAFRLSGSATIRNLSRGQRARVGLLAALAHRPALLLLDEPSAGLDAVVRRDIVDAVFRIASEDGRTVLFSSHLLNELQQVSDRILLLRRGRIGWDGDIRQLINSHVSVHLTIPAPSSPPHQSWHDEVSLMALHGRGQQWQCIVKRVDLDQLHRCVEESGGSVTEQHEPSLQELFVALSESDQEDDDAI